MEQGWDPQVRKYFRKILNSIGYGLAWMFACMIAGIYYRLGYAGDHPVWYTLLFYILATVTLLLLVRYLFKTWKTAKGE